MDEKQQELFDAVKEAYRDGFRDGFEYGTGKPSPYAATIKINEPNDTFESVLKKALNEKTIQ